MGWNGSGVFTRTNGTNSGANLWENDRDAGIKITAENHDNQDQDLADGIQNCLTKDGQNFPTADLPLNNQKHTGVGAATAATHYARTDQVQNGAFMWGGTAAGTADAITFNLTPTLTAYTTGLTVRFLASGTTTVTNPTININAAGAKTVKDQDGNALSVGDIASGTVYEAVYDGTDFRIYVAAVQDLSDYVTGPASATDSAVALFDGTGGKTLKDGVVLGTSSGNIPQVGTKSATETLAGLVELATQAEAEAGTDDTVVMTALKTAQAIAALGSSITLGTAQASTSGTAIDFTSIPSGTKRITVNFVGVSTNGTSFPMVQIGDSGGLETSGYAGAARYLGDTSGALSSGFTLVNTHGAVAVYHGRVTLELVDASTFTWTATSGLARGDLTVLNVMFGSKSLSAELDRIRITTAGGSDTFDAGKINIIYE